MGWKICTGYPYKNISDPSADIFAIYQEKESSSGLPGRMELFNLWSIIRNHGGSNAGVKTQNLRTTGGWVRVHGGYFQAEDGLASQGPSETAGFANDGFNPDEIELYPDVRYKKILGETVQIGPACGVQLVTSDTESQVGDGGLKLCDATSGPIKLASIGEEYILERVDTSGNLIKVNAGAGGNIEDRSTMRLGQ